jgi:hypothetical protein
MSPRWCTVDSQATLAETTAPPAGSRPIAQATALLLPPLISSLHSNFHAWEMAGLSPGPVVAERVWVNPAGELAFEFKDSRHPTAIYPVGRMAGLAAWLVLLDKWVETFVVIARARAVWSPVELAGALSFTTPSLLPAQLVRTAPDNWERVALALALAVADGPLAGGRRTDGHPTGAHTDRHWRK